ncbi:amino acid ABC transporter [Aliidongia dinghuensis]|uniref:Amino acid ABC transporter n=1 Tax=Aliidongia dinghuensis TaxID=1867774 RepID=A0A8J2Z044_9PROT|nr:amino acid ABC transporter permease [Aliidongia dinghuensis]GGF43302.1 amino acid ABC transporter [Aliidongia dinghuensis]
MIEALIKSFVAAARSLGFNFSFLASAYERGMWLDGIRTTLELAAVTIPASLAAGLVLVLALRSPWYWLAGPSRAFIELTRSTPTLVQLDCAFLALNMLVSAALGGAEHNPLTPFFWCVLVIALHIGAFHAEALRAGVEAVPEPTREAARALGFGRAQVLWRIELPIAFRVALPALVNNLVNLIKLTAIGSAIAVGDITYASIMIWTQHDNVVELMLFILLLFGALNFIVSRAGRWLEARVRIPGHGV